MDLQINKTKNFTIRTCRICLNSKLDNFVLLDETVWYQLFEYCFNIVISAQDEPQILCGNCATNVKKFAEFKEKCHKSQEIWNSLAANLKCNIDKIDLPPKCSIKSNSIDVEVPQKCPDKNDKDDKNILITWIEKDEILNENLGDDFLDDTETLDVEVKEENDNDDNNEFEVGELRTQLKDDEANSVKEEKDDVIDRVVEKAYNIAIKFDQINGIKEEGVLSKDNKNKEVNKRKRKKLIKELQCKNCHTSYERRKFYEKHIAKCTRKIKKSNLPKSSRKLPDGLVIDFDWDLPKNDKDNNVKTSLDKIIPEDAKHFCGICDLTFAKSGDMDRHLNEHWKSGNLKCQLCEFVAHDLANLFTHRYVHSPLKKDLLCHICGKNKKISLISLNYHYRQEHLQKNGAYCVKCNREFNSLKVWKKHMRSSHSSGGYFCDYCGRRCAYKNLLVEHIRTHTRHERHICETCGKTYLRASYLRLHIETVHTKNEPLKCYHCNKMYKSEFRLKQHLDVIENGKPVKCEICSKTLPGFKYLKPHMVSHSDERPYCCDICGVRYKAKCILTIHMRKHTGIMPYKCPSCPKEFASPNLLKTHSSVHTGIRANKCPYCDRSFHGQYLVRQHCQRHHKNMKELE